jgi:hypothetical protein
MRDVRQQAAVPLQVQYPVVVASGILCVSIGVVAAATVVWNCCIALEAKESGVNFWEIGSVSPCSSIQRLEDGCPEPVFEIWVHANIGDKDVDGMVGTISGGGMEDACFVDVLGSRRVRYVRCVMGNVDELQIIAGGSSVTIDNYISLHCNQRLLCCSCLLLIIICDCYKGAAHVPAAIGY